MAGRESLQIPGDVFADVAACLQLAAIELGEVLGVTPDRRSHLPQSRLDPGPGPGECRREVGEQPRSSQASPTHHDAIATRCLDHVERVLRRPDIAVTQHRDCGHDLFQCLDGRPVSLTRIPLGGGPRMQGHRGHPLPLGDPAGLQERQVVGVDAFAHLEGDRHVIGGSLFDRLADDRTEQVSLPWQCRTAALAGDLGDRTAKVEIDVIGTVLTNE